MEAKKRENGICVLPFYNVVADCGVEYDCLYTCPSSSSSMCVLYILNCTRLSSWYGKIHPNLYLYTHTHSEQWAYIDTHGPRARKQIYSQANIPQPTQLFCLTLNGKSEKEEEEQAREGEKTAVLFQLDFCVSRFFVFFLHAIHHFGCSSSPTVSPHSVPYMNFAFVIRSEFTILNNISFSNILLVLSFSALHCSVAICLGMVARIKWDYKKIFSLIQPDAARERENANFSFASERRQLDGFLRLDWPNRRY